MAFRAALGGEALVAVATVESTVDFSVAISGVAAVFAVAATLEVATGLGAVLVLELAVDLRAATSLEAVVTLGFTLAAVLGIVPATGTVIC